MLVEYIRSLPCSVFNSVLPWLVMEVSEEGRGFMEYLFPEIPFSCVLLIIMCVAIHIAVPSKAVFVAAFWIFVANSQYSILHAFWYTYKLPRLDEKWYFKLLFCHSTVFSTCFLFTVILVSKKKNTDSLNFVLYFCKMSPVENWSFVLRKARL